jgi:hypothetical protein
MLSGDGGKHLGRRRHVLLVGAIIVAVVAVTLSVGLGIGSSRSARGGAYVPMLPGDSVSTVACDESANCTAAGSYGIDGGSGAAPFLVREVHGVWEAPWKIPIPNASGDATPEGFPGSLSCSTQQSCVVVGTWTNNANAAFYLDEHHGKWGRPHYIWGPLGAGGSVAGQAGAVVTCLRPENCVVLAQVALPSISQWSWRTYVVKLVDGTWTEPQSVQAIPSTGRLGGITCISLDSCIASGRGAYSDDYWTDTMHAGRFLQTRWIAPAVASLESNVGIDTTQQCLPTGVCLVGSEAAPLVDEVLRGHVIGTHRFTLPTHAPGFRYVWPAFTNGIACSPAGTCLVMDVGWASNKGTSGRDVEGNIEYASWYVRGRWLPPVLLGKILKLDISTVWEMGASCLGRHVCVLQGLVGKPGHQQAFIETVNIPQAAPR